MYIYSSKKTDGTFNVGSVGLPKNQGPLTPRTLPFDAGYTNPQGGDWVYLTAAGVLALLPPTAASVNAGAQPKTPGILTGDYDTFARDHLLGTHVTPGKLSDWIFEAPFLANAAAAAGGPYNAGTMLVSNATLAGHIGSTFGMTNNNTPMTYSYNGVLQNTSAMGQCVDFTKTGQTYHNLFELVAIESNGTNTPGNTGDLTLDFRAWFRVTAAAILVL